MSKGNTAENDLLLNWFNGTALSWAANTHVYLALHTSDPGEAGDQTSNEVSGAAYTSYARIGVIRTSGGWTVSSNTASNAALAQFPQCTGGSGATITHVSVGTATSGAGQILYSGALNSSLAVANLIQPQFAIGALVISED